LISLERTELFYKTVYFIAPKYWQAVSNRRNWQEPTSFPCVVWMELPEVTSGKCVTGVCRVAVDSAEKCRYTCPTMHQMPLSNGRHKCIVEDTINWDSNLLRGQRQNWALNCAGVKLVKFTCRLDWKGSTVH